MTYSVSQQFYFREIHRSVPAGGTVYLEDSVAQKYAESHPGLLSPARTTTQAVPEAVRTDDSEDMPRPRGRRKSA